MKRGIWALLLLACCMSCASAASLEDFSFEKKPTCYENGQFTFSVTQDSKTGSIGEVVGGIGIRRLTADEYNRVSGDWYSSNHTPAGPSQPHSGEHFISEEFQVTSPGNYSVLLSPKPVHVTDFYPEMQVLQSTMQCPGYLHSCRMLNISITECYRKGETLEVYFTGLGKDTHSQVEPQRDLGITLNPFSSSRVAYPLHEKGPHSFTALGNDHFKATLPLQNLTETVLRIRLTTEGCNPRLHSITDIRTCGVIAADKSNESRKNSTNTTQASDNESSTTTPRKIQGQPLGAQEDSPYYLKLLGFLMRMIPI